MPPGPRITVRLTPALDALVSDHVRQGTSVSDLVREALEAYLGVRQTPTRAASASAPTVADAVADAVSDMRERLAYLEQRVQDLSDSVRQSGTLSDTQETIDMPASPVSDTMSDTCQTLAERVSPTESPMLSDTHEALPATLSDIDVPPFDTSKFLLGPLCKKKHDYYGTGHTLRRVKSHGCPQCDVERTREQRKAKRDAAS
jgi:Arc/MetJ-type ribon-helix-helix transcriptional regulator